MKFRWGLIAVSICSTVAWADEPKKPVSILPSDYTYSCWQNGWRKNPNDASPDIFGVETSHYGFTLDVADFRQTRLGQLHNPAGYAEALAHKAEKLKQLPPAELIIEVEIDGMLYRAQACRAGRQQGVKHLSHVRLWESGRYVQHYDFLGLDLQNANGERPTLDATLNLVAWPTSLTLSLEVVFPFSHRKCGPASGSDQRCGKLASGKEDRSALEAGRDKERFAELYYSIDQ